MVGALAPPTSAVSSKRGAQRRWLPDGPKPQRLRQAHGPRRNGDGDGEPRATMTDSAKSVCGVETRDATLTSTTLLGSLSRC